jgi:uncharacterized protein
MKRVLLMAVVLLGMALAAPVRAQEPLEAGKRAGLIGEWPDGLVGMVDSALPADLRTLVERINAQRLDRYRAVAQQNGLALDKVQAVAGRQLIDRTPSGQFVLDGAGRWLRKP